LKVDDKTLEKLDKTAKELGMNRSQLIRKLINDDERIVNIHTDIKLRKWIADLSKQTGLNEEDIIIYSLLVSYSLFYGDTPARLILRPLSDIIKSAEKSV